MSDEQKQELKKNGFVIFSNYQFFVTLLIVVVSFLITIGAGMERFSNIQRQVEQNIIDIDKTYTLYQQNTSIQKNIKFNLKILMNKFKLDYVEDTDK